MILVVGPSPAFQQRMVFEAVALDEVNRARQVEALPSGKPINCARALRRLGVPSRVVLFLGGTIGEWIHRELDAEGISHRAVPARRRRGSRARSLSRDPRGPRSSSRTHAP